MRHNAVGVAPDITGRPRRIPLDHRDFIRYAFISQYRNDIPNKPMIFRFSTEPLSLKKGRSFQQGSNLNPHCIGKFAEHFNARVFALEKLENRLPGYLSPIAHLLADLLKA